jgi:hypothetical protein
MTDAIATGSPVLRVAAVWGTTVVTLRTLVRGLSFEMGEGKGAVLPIPDGIEMPDRPLRGSPLGGWDLDARGVVLGALRLRGRDADPVTLAKTGAAVDLLPGDYGLLQYGLFAVFFQCGAEAPSVGTGTRIEILALLALLSSSTLHIGALGMVRGLMTPSPLDRPMELQSPDESAHFALGRAMVEPAPPAEGEKATSAANDPAPAPTADTSTEGVPKVPSPTSHAPSKPAHHPGALGEVLTSDAGDEVRRTLAGIESVDKSVRGLSSDNLVWGPGSGSGLHGTDPGGGGAPGSAYRAGELDTGKGVGGGPGGAHNGPGGRPFGGDKGGRPVERQTVVGEQRLPPSGALSPDQVSRVVNAHLGALRACYTEEAMRNPRFRGGATLAWQISPSGDVTSSRTEGSTLNNARVEGCLLRQVKGWRFPKAEAPTIVAGYSFRFVSESP